MRFTNNFPQMQLIHFSEVFSKIVSTKLSLAESVSMN